MPLLDRPRHAIFALLIIFGGGLLVGAILAKYRPPPQLAQPPSSLPVYSTTNPLALRAGDEIELTRADPSDPDSQRVRDLKIDADGVVRLPIIGGIMARGLTPQQLEREIAQAYRDRNLVSNARIKVVRKGGPVPTTQPATRP
jgi:protein involved in polysaccharide export with SLBB domain